MRVRSAFLAPAAFVVFAAACGGDTTPGTTTPGPASLTATTTASAPTPTATPDRRTPTPTPTAPPDLTSAQVCDLVPATNVAAALGVPSVEQEAVATSTPQCSYTFPSVGTTNNVVLAVMRDADVGGRTGSDAFEYAVSINRALAGGGADEREVPNLGDQAVFMAGDSVRLLIVQAGLRIITVAGTELTAEQAGAIALDAVESQGHET